MDSSLVNVYTQVFSADRGFPLQQLYMLSLLIIGSAASLAQILIRRRAKTPSLNLYVCALCNVTVQIFFLSHCQVSLNGQSFLKSLIQSCHTNHDPFTQLRNHDSSVSFICFQKCSMSSHEFPTSEIHYSNT